MPVISISPTSGLAYGGVTVATSATRIGPSNGAPRQSISIFNADPTTTLYIGTDSAVTTGTGWPVLPLTSLDLEIDSTVTVYGIAASSISVRYLEPRG